MGAEKSPCGNVRRHSVFLKHRNPVERRLSGARIAQWFGTRTRNPGVPGSIPKGRGSIFVNPSIIFNDLWVGFGSLVGHVGVTLWSWRGHVFCRFGDVWGCVWEYCGDVFGRFLERSEGGVEKPRFSKMSGSNFPKSVVRRLTFLACSRHEMSKIMAFMFVD